MSSVAWSRGPHTRASPSGPRAVSGQEGEGAGGDEEQAAVADVDGQLGEGAGQEVLEQLVRDEGDRAVDGALAGRRGRGRGSRR